MVQRMTGCGAIILGLGGFVLFLTNPDIRDQPVHTSMIDGSLGIAIMLLGASQLLRPTRPYLSNRLVLLGGIFATIGLLRFISH